MEHKFYYTKYALRCFRIISVIYALFLVFTEVMHFFTRTSVINIIKDATINYSDLFTRIVNFIVIVLFIIIAVFPKKIGLLSCTAFFYSFTIIPFEPQNYMGLLMYVLGISILLARGLMKNHKKTKLIILGCVYFALLLTHLRFGFHNFINYFVINAGGILVLALAIFFFHGYYLNTIMFEGKKLNLALYPKLNERDCRILQGIQKREKYSVIANNEGITEGTLKNRLHEVYNILECGDKQGFLSYYEDWELLFDPSLLPPPPEIPEIKEDA
ncbi:MAG: hypothetical protein K5829_13395 [Treponema sp.]|nr:hypothetical protein [Treponema sp.]